MSQIAKIACLACACVFVAFAVEAAPKIDKETCAQLKGEQATFIQSGILADIQRGPAWAKSNLAPERIREIELFITLDEQIKFGCREVTLTGDAIRAGEAAQRLELNPNADPTAPPPAAAKEGDDASAPATAPGTNESGNTTGNTTGNAESGDASDTAPASAPAAKSERRARPGAQPKTNDAYTPPSEDNSSPAASGAEGPAGRVTP